MSAPSDELVVLRVTPHSLGFRVWGLTPSFFAHTEPLEDAAMVYYGGAFPNEFGIMLRERRSQTLLQMQGDVVALEGNLITGGKIKK